MLFLEKCQDLLLADLIEEDLIEKIPNYDHYVKTNALYIHSFTIREDMRGKGINKILLNDFPIIAKSMGYTTLVAHLQPRLSQYAIRKNISTIIQSYENYFDTGKTFDFHEFKL